MNPRDAQAVRAIRRKIIQSCYGNGGHIGGALSVVDALYVLYRDLLADGQNDFIFSKGHAVPALYAVLNYTKIISDEEYASYGCFGTNLIQHPSSQVAGITYSSGALGNGLSVGLGMALANLQLQNDRKVYVVMGDGEINEGTAWEGFMYIGSHQVSNVVGILDHNGLQASATTEELLKTRTLINGIQGLGWHVVEVDGHDIEAITSRLSRSYRKPVLLVLNTIKGKGVSFMENDVTWHHRHLTEEEYKSAIKELA